MMIENKSKQLLSSEKRESKAQLGL